MAHPLTTFGTIEENLLKINAICKAIMVEYPDVVPFSPLHAFSFFDNKNGSQEQVMGYCLKLLSKCDEIWLFGQWEESKGCMQELVFATKNNIPVRADIIL